ncbi:MAG TPA: hypothetical protein VN934_06500 [Candidatus Tumulicola sp.]|nr:hypothetical protein [Candidatus Tumulicola sp.]
MALARVQKKLSLAERAIAEMEVAQTAQQDDDFEYHFSTFLANARAAAEYVRKDAASRGGAAAAWWTAKEDDLDIATIIGLRNADIHDGTIIRNRHWMINIFETLPPITDSVEVQHPWWLARFWRWTLSLLRFRRRASGSGSSYSTAAMVYVIRAANLDPSSFMVDPRYGANRNKSRVEAYLPGQSLTQVGHAFLKKIRFYIPEGESTGHLTP